LLQRLGIIGIFFILIYSFYGKKLSKRFGLQNRDNIPFIGDFALIES
jgi:hypothetical protein